MVSTVYMPKLGLTMTKGLVVSWVKKEGEQVQKGEKIAIIETEKVTAEITAPASGIMLKILAAAKSSVPVGQAVAFIGNPGEALPSTAQGDQSGPQPSGAQGERAVPSISGSSDRALSATPRAKRVAKERGVDLSQVKGRGPLGMISEEDVLLHVERARGSSRTGVKVRESRPLSGIRRTIAERMTASLQTTAQLSMTYEVDATELSKARGASDGEPHVSYTAILVKVVAKALREFPMMNSTLEDDEIKALEEINVGVAVSTDDGLMVPVIRNADAKSAREVAVAVRDLAERARTGRLSLDDVSGGTFTITNLGMTAVDTFTPIVNPPQVGILGVGRISNKPVAAAAGIEVRPRLNLSLSFDHRVIDGYAAGVFIGRLAELIETEALLREILA